MALDASAQRTGWLRISVGMASQQSDRNQRVCIMLGTSAKRGERVRQDKIGQSAAVLHHGIEHSGV
jgi:hypothetical protein